MKKILSLLSGVVMIAGIAIAVVAQSNRNSVFDFNVEALSVIEEGEHGTGKCWYSTKATENEMLLVCVSCVYIQAKHTLLSNTGNCN